MKKTTKNIVVPISANALKWMPNRGKAKDTDLIFADLPCNTTINNDLKTWCRNAGISKSVCFHVSRHTFATLSLEFGTDIATVSELLGHANLRTTQIYAKVVNNSLFEAAKKMDNGFNV